MSLDSIVNRILEDARAKAARTEKEARARAEQLIKEARASSEQSAKVIVDEAGRLAKQETDRTYIIKNLEVRKEIAGAKLHWVNRAFEKAFSGMLSLDNARYIGVVEEGILGVNETEGVLTFSRRDSSRLDERFVSGFNRAHDARFKFGGYFDADDGGFILEKERVRIDMRFSTLLKEIRQRLLFDAAEVLFK